MSIKPRRRARGDAAARPLLEAARQHIREGRLYEAKEAATGMLARSPAQGTVVALGRALECAGTGVEGRLVLGLALREQGRPADAELVLRDALSHRPQHPALLLELGNALNALGRREEAIGALEQAVRVQPTYSSAHFNLGNLLREAGRLHEAVAAYESALRLTPDYAEACYNLGIALENLREPARAIAAYRRAAELRPDHATLGTSGRARAFARECLERRPDFTIRRLMAKVPFRDPDDSAHLVECLRAARLPE